MEIEYPVAPGPDRVIGRQQFEIADRTCPLEGAEDDVVGIGGRVAGDEILPLDGAAQRIEASAKRRQPRFAVSHDLFQGLAKALLARAAKIILILRARVAMDVEDDERDDARLQHRLGPVLHKARQRAAGLAAKQGRPVGIVLLEIIGNRGRIVDDGPAVDDHRYPAGVGRWQLVFLGKAPRHGLDREPLMCERHPRTPAKRAKAPVLLGAGEVVEGDGHASVLSPNCHNWGVCWLAEQGGGVVAKARKCVPARSLSTAFCLPATLPQRDGIECANPLIQMAFHRERSGPSKLSP